MKFIIILLTIYIFLKTIYYGIYEYKDNNNKLAGIFIIIFSFVSLILPNIMIYIR
jgi:hypothetical protein